MHQNDQPEDDDEEERGGSTRPVGGVPLFLNTHDPFCLVAVGVQVGQPASTMTSSLPAYIDRSGRVADIGSAVLAVQKRAMHHWERKGSLLLMGLLCVLSAGVRQEPHDEPGGRELPAAPAAARHHPPAGQSDTHTCTLHAAAPSTS